MTDPVHRPSAALTHTVLATGLVDADRLAAWRADPGQLAGIGVDPSTMDLDALTDFAGLSEKVRHNQCRHDLQQTFRLLVLTGLEIALFREYTPVSLRRRRAGLNSTPDRIAGLTEFVEGWAPDDDPERTLIRDVLGHEHTVVELRRAGLTRPPDTVAERPSGKAVPLHNGRIVVRSSTCDPRQVGLVLKTREPDLARIERGTWTLVYRRGFDGSLAMFEVDSGVGELLLAVDGETTVGDLATRLRVPPAQLTTALDRLTEAGLLLWFTSGD